MTLMSALVLCEILKESGFLSFYPAIGFWVPSLGLFLLRIPSQKVLGTERVITRMSSPMVCLRMLHSRNVQRCDRGKRWPGSHMQ